MNQRKLEANSCKRHKTRENAFRASLVLFWYYLFRKWCEFNSTSHRGSHSGALDEEKRKENGERSRVSRARSGAWKELLWVAETKNALPRVKAGYTVQYCVHHCTQYCANTMYPHQKSVAATSPKKNTGVVSGIDVHQNSGVKINVKFHFSPKRFPVPFQIAISSFTGLTFYVNMNR